MKIGYTLRLAFSNLAHSGLRTWLTVIGIVIGVTAVVMIVSIGNGLQANVQNQLSRFGADIVTISPGFSRASSNFGFRGGPGGEGGGGGNFFQNSGRTAQNITTRDLQVIKLATNVKEVTGIISGRATVNFGSDSTNAQVRGVDPLVWKDVSDYTIGQGRDLTPGDANAVVIGYRMANQQFSKPITPNSIITINDKVFRVVGILAQSGSAGGDDNTILMPLATARQVLEGFTPDQFATIYVKVVDTSLVDQTVSDIQTRLMQSRHVTQKTQDFSVTSAAALRATVSSVTQSISLFLGAIAAVSLLVGAIGIANTMFMAVLERTKQIGVFKALGTTRWETTRLFLIESSMLGLAGGIIGVALSTAIVTALVDIGVGFSLLPTQGSRGGSSFLITPDLVAFALLFSLIIGAGAGYFPARKAASLRPIEALRYE